MLPTQEEVAKKIMDYVDMHKDKHFHLHNPYYIITVDENNNICQEAYGVNVMTNYGMKNKWYTDGGNNTAFSAMNIHIGSGTIRTGYEVEDAPKFGIGYSSMVENIVSVTATAWNSNGIIRTGYDDLNTTENGVLYSTQYNSYGQIDYEQTLPNTSATFDGHTGGAPTAGDTRWVQDETDTSRYYFNITEIGIGPATNQLFFHFLIRDINGDYAPIRKYNNQKLYVYTFLTYVLSEKMILDAWDRGEYITANPRGDAYDDSYRWYQYIEYGSSTRQDIGMTYNPPSIMSSNNYSYFYENKHSSANTSSGLLRSWLRTDGTEETTVDDTQSHFIRYSPSMNSRLVENWQIFLTDITLIMGYIENTGGSDYWMSKTGITDTALRLTTYEELDHAETHVAADVFTNSTSSYRFDYQFSLRRDSNAKQGRFSVAQFDTIDYLRKFNCDTNEYDITTNFTYNPNYFSETWFRRRAKYTNFILPSGDKGNVYVYYNYMAEATESPAHNSGYRPNQTINQITTTGLTLYASDRPWDVTTWRRIENLLDAGNEVDENNKLLVKKRYIISVNVDGIIYFNLKDNMYPKIIPDFEQNTNIYNNSDVHYTGRMMGDDSDVNKQYFMLGTGLYKLDPTTHALKTTDASGNPRRVNVSELSRSTQYVGSYGTTFWWRHGTYTHGSVFLFGNAYPEDASKDYEAYIYDFYYNFPSVTSQEVYIDDNNGKYVTITHNNQLLIVDLSTIFSRLSTWYSSGTTTVLEGSSNSDWIATSSTYRNENVTYVEATVGNHLRLQYNLDGDRYGYQIKEFDENKNELTSWSDRISKDFEYVVKNTDCAYVKIAIYNGGYSSGYHDIPGDVIVQRFNSNLEFPIISNARYATCLRGSNYVVYNDTTDSVVARTWNIIDMSDPLDENDEPKIVETFQINENFIGSFIGTTGFNHQFYVAINDASGTVINWLYNMDEQDASYKLAQLDDHTNYYWNLSTGNRYCTFEGNDKCLVFVHNRTDASNGDKRYDNVTNRNCYIIPYDNPKTIYALYTPLTSYPYQSLGEIQLKYVTYPDQLNEDNTPKRQLLLAIQGICNSSASLYHNHEPVCKVLDIGLWLKTHSWPNNAPVTRSSRSTTEYTGTSYTYIVGNGVIALYGSGIATGTSRLGYYPIECWVPHKCQITSKCITAMTNPFKLNSKSWTLDRTNDMTQFGIVEGEHVWDGT